MFTLAAAGQRNSNGRTRTGPRGQARALGRAASASCPSHSASCPWPPGRGDRHAGRGPGARADHRGREPGGVHPQQRAAREGDRGLDFMSRRRHLRERDDASRRRDPARTGAAWPSRTTTSPSTSWPLAASPTTRPRSSRTRARPSGRRCSCASPASWAARGPNAGRRRARSISWSSHRWLGSEVADPHSRVAGRDAAEILAEIEPRRGPERMLDLMLRTGPFGDAFGAEPGRADPRPARAQPARDRPGRAPPADTRGAAHRLGKGSSSPRSRSSPTFHGWRRRPSAT